MSDDMARFWDARAREDALFFIDDRRRYRDPDLDSFWASGRQDLQQILDVLGAEVTETDVVLDIGCGVGRLTRALSASAREVYGLDVSAEMLERARQINADLTNVHWVHGDGCSLAPIPDAGVDACVSHVVFQHVPDPRITMGYVAEMGRVLRPGGWAAFQVSNDPRIHRRPPLARRLKNRLRAIAGQPSGRENPAWLGSAVDLEELRKVAAQAHLVLERITGEGTQFCLILGRRQDAPVTTS